MISCGTGHRAGGSGIGIGIGCTVRTAGGNKTIYDLRDFQVPVLGIQSRCKTGFIYSFKRFLSKNSLNIVQNILIESENRYPARISVFLTFIVKIPRTVNKPENSALIIRKPDCIIVLALKYLHGIFMSGIISRTYTLRN